MVTLLMIWTLLKMIDIIHVKGILLVIDVTSSVILSCKSSCHSIFIILYLEIEHFYLGMTQILIFSFYLKKSVTFYLMIPFYSVTISFYPCFISYQILLHLPALITFSSLKSFSFTFNSININKNIHILFISISILIHLIVLTSNAIVCFY